MQVKKALELMKEMVANDEEKVAEVLATAVEIGELAENKGDEALINYTFTRVLTIYALGVLDGRRAAKKDAK
jgi:hypothetical protein